MKEAVHMQLVTIMQFIHVLAVYLVMSLVLPAILFYRKLKKERLPVRIMMYISIGNIYMVSLVMLVSLVYILLARIGLPVTAPQGDIPKIQLTTTINRIVYTALLVLTCITVKLYQNTIPFRGAVSHVFDYLWKITTRTIGLKSTLVHVVLWLWRSLKHVFSHIKKLLLAHPIELFFLTGVCVLLALVYGRDMIEILGYRASDISVHQYWTNSIDRNLPLVDGVYPFGAHAAMFYLHIIFNIDTAILFRVFAYVQTATFFLILVLFVRCLCKSKFIVYAGLFAVLAGRGFSGGAGVDMRYFATLPQEYGMIFLLPSVYFLMRFFYLRRQEVGTGTLQLEKILKVSKELVERRVKKPKKEKPLEDREQSENKKNVKPKALVTSFNPSKPFGLFKRKKKKSDYEALMEELTVEAEENYTQEVSYEEDITDTKELLGEVSSYEEEVIHEEPEFDEWEELDKRIKTREERRSRRTEARRYRKERRIFLMSQQSFLYLVLFAVDFSLTISAHFYTGIIAAVFFVGVALSYILRVFDKAYFGRLVAGGIGGLAIAAVPLVVAFMLGTPLQGSLTWAMGVMGVDSKPAVSAPSEGGNKGKNIVIDMSKVVDTTGDSDSGVAAPAKNSSVVTKVTKGVVNAGKKVIGGIVGTGKGFVNFFAHPLDQEVIVKLKNCLRGGMNTALQTDKFGNLIFLSIYGLLVFGLVFRLLGDMEYGAAMVATGVFLLLLTFDLDPNATHMPRVMELSRICSYYYYVLAIPFAFCADAILSLLLLPFKKRRWKKWILHTASAICVLITIIYMSNTGHVKDFSKPAREVAFVSVSNGEIACVAKIRKEETSYNWTIVSAFEAMRLLDGYGYHHELVDFLGEMEGSRSDSSLYIPTKKVYFFMEKRPIIYEYTNNPDRSRISEEEASKSFPGMGFASYKYKNRVILMSKMYFWAQQFRTMYPDALQVYYEDDEFVCYVIEQNTSNLYNFSIDYGFNGKSSSTSQIDEIFVR
ncbi:hypothetical protein FACS1894111_06710 [Clostridia bacterium]|nr:hypothetical protein FACS1894111_06710 [Clostridia bacterium]